MWMPVAPLGGSHADRNARGVRRDARPSQAGRVRLPGSQRHLVGDAQRRPARLRGGGKRLLGVGERGRYLLAATFGNVHGVYQPGHVKLRPKLLDEIQRAVAARVGYLAKAETSMAARVVQACNDLGSAGTSLMQAG
jgi:Fructose-bisphosphate aldolase class-II